MRNIKLTIQFDGTGYHGWQTQSTDCSVQQTVQEALARILNCAITLHGSGRTDAGVHALGQVAHFSTASDIDLNQLVSGLNSLLPSDVVVHRAENVPADFHARYSATARVYWYFIWNSSLGSPFCSKYAWHVKKLLNSVNMKSAAAHLVGVHDFSSFQASDKQKVNPVREVTRVRLRRVRTDLLVFEIRANAFLKHMVRNIIGTLVEVGKGKITVEEFKDILDANDRTCAGPAAPARGLFLKEVIY